MPRHKKGTTKRRTNHLKNARNARAANQTSEKENVDPNVEEMKKVEARARRAERRLREERKKVQRLEKDAKNSAGRDRRHEKARAEWKEKEKNLRSELDDEIARAESCVCKAVQQGLKNTKEAEKQLVRIGILLEQAHHDAESFRNLNFQQQQDLVILRKVVQNHQKKLRRAHLTRTRLVQKQHNSRLLAKIKVKGAYTPEVRSLARIFTTFGTVKSRVGKAVQEAAALFGYKVPKMSKDTVRRTIHEGHIMAKIQAGLELEETTGE
ncbi:hypothetical protein VKT23_014071 [Stygiomarasmius scandens]|uniref:Uncharacterized protein n=1 Tax=Marasmiellus scandens TaxID=2682957 RepID=A0ABR1J400_9AGAR